MLLLMESGGEKADLGCHCGCGTHCKVLLEEGNVYHQLLGSANLRSFLQSPKGGQLKRNSFDNGSLCYFIIIILKTEFTTTGGPRVHGHSWLLKRG